MNKVKIKHQKTKIVATLGPSSSKKEVMLEMIQAGVDVFRVNFSHGTEEQHTNVFNLITQINQEFDINIGILADLQGPKLRIGEIENNALNLTKDQILTFTNKKCVGNADKIYMSYTQFAQDVEPKEKVLLDDGKIILQVVETNKKDTVKLKVLNNGVLSSNKGVNLPDTKITLPALTEKDLKDIDFMLNYPVNWIGLSFVRSHHEIAELKSIINSRGHLAKVIAKIEKPEALLDLKAIIKEADGVMVARGDLGVEVAMEKLPALQKDIIAKCIQKAKPVIVATQMMESMISNPSPTRAEITDVANAVLDGADAVMLSGETSVGLYPVEVIKAMSKIIEEAEKHYEITGKRPKPNRKSDTYYSDVICVSAAKLAEDIKAKAIVGITVSGYTAFKVSSYRPNSHIYIFSSVRAMAGTLNLVWGVQTLFYDKFTSTDETIEDLVGILKEKKLLKDGEVVVNTASMPLHKRFRTNTLKITVVE